MVQGWIDIARGVAETVGTATSVNPREAFLNDRLVQFTYDPPNADAAPLMLIASESELIVCAGRGTRFELPALPTSATEALQIVEAVASGRLTERVKGSRVTFELLLDDGSELSGQSNMAGQSRSEAPMVIEYSPYAG
jgi:hypothetical protein